MARSTIIVTALLLGSKAVVAYEKFQFATEESQWLCPGMQWQCIAPSICAYDKVVDRWDCCDTDDEGAVCWNNATPCSGENNTTGSNQVGCSSGVDAFCCLKDRETCTQRTNQINVCWEEALDPFQNVSEAKMNATFSSLSSANPSASTLAVVDVAALTAVATASSSATPSATSTSTSARQSHAASSSSSSSSSPSDTATQAPKSDNGVSGGTIGGAVVGAVAGIALIGGGAFFLFRRAKGSHSHPKDNELDAENPYIGNQSYQQTLPQEKYAHEAAVQAHTSYPPQELPANQYPIEMEGEGSSVPPPRVPHSFA